MGFWSRVKVGNRSTGKRRAQTRPVRELFVVEAGGEECVCCSVEVASGVLFSLRKTSNYHLVINAFVRYPTGTKGMVLSKGYIMGVFSKALGSGGKKKGSVRSRAEDPWIKADMPILHEFLTAVVDDDGKARQTSSLVVFVEDGMFKVCLSERDHGLCLWGASSTLQGAMEAIEVSLSAEHVDWRQKRSEGRPAKKG